MRVYQGRTTVICSRIWSVNGTQEARTTTHSLAIVTKLSSEMVKITEDAKPSQKQVRHVKNGMSMYHMQFSQLKGHQRMTQTLSITIAEEDQAERLLGAILA